MLCNITPVSLTVSSIINNAKSITRFDKHSMFEKPDSSHLDKFIKDLGLSSETLKVVEKSMKKVSRMRIYDNNIFNRKKFNNIELLFKRNFYHKVNTNSRFDSEKEHKRDSSSSRVDLSDLLEKYNSKPLIQQHINEAYRLASEKAVTMVVEDKRLDRRGVNIRFCIYVVIGSVFLYILSEIRKSITSGASTGSLAKIFSKSWSQSGASLVTKVDVKFEDVQGCDEVKKELQDIVNFLRNPSTFTDMGAKLPKGVLLIGEPGIGKTLLARAVAGEAGVPFLFVSGSQFDEMFVGVGASRIRALFSEAKEHSPCVVFIDELDAVCGERTSSPSHPYANQTINQLLSEMDGFVENEGIVIIGATNRLKALDKAVLRPGRFDLKVQVHRPDYRGRLALFDLYLSKVIIGDTIDVAALARSTTGYTGADIKNMVNQATIICVLKECTSVTMTHLWEAQTKMTLGAARTRPMQESENRLTAYHEAGHSIVTYFSPNSSNKVKLVTILPRGESGGHNSFMPKVETSYYSKAQLKSMIDGLMGGRAAEELLSGADNISTGVSSDMEKATDLARQMVKRYTMGEADVGLQVYGSDNCQCGGASRSPKVSEAIDSEVNRILRESYERARTILTDHSKEWHALATNLLKYETLEGDDIDLIIAGKTPRVALAVDSLVVAKTGAKKPSFVEEPTKRFLDLFSGGKDVKK